MTEFVISRLRPNAALRRIARLWLLALFGLLLSPLAHSADPVCARVKIEIKQELTLERQAFDATMKINNGLDTTSLDNVSVNVTFKDEAGNAVKATSDPNDLSAAFYIRIDSMSGISDVAGNGKVAPATTAEIHWLIIPAPGSGGSIPSGKLYLVGATLNYKIGGDAQTVTVAPDSIYVKPLPLLTLDYFLTQEVVADDAFTAAIEPSEPFTLGVRIKNTGAATAKNVKIASAQPKIVENQQGLLINFLITGSYLNDQPANPSLLIPFGDIAANRAATGRWNMITTLSGKFVDFKATFTHADELGGALTSILQATHAHFLIRDVRVDLPGRDMVRDFLARDGNAIRVYESDLLDTLVTDQSNASTFAPGVNGVYTLNAPATAGFMYVSLPDPFSGAKTMGKVVRADGKVLAAENVWFSKTRNADKITWKYLVNFFDVNHPGGAYQVAVSDPKSGPRAPVLQFIPNKTVKEGQQVSFIVEASDPDGTIPTLAAAPLPTGAKFTDQGNGVGIFDWTPAVGQAGKYTITYTASDGALEATASASITVESATPPAGPDIPSIVAPQVGTEVLVLQPILVVGSNSSLDTAKSYEFEVYSDANLSQLVANIAGLAKAGETTTWKVAIELKDNTRYYWRVRSFDGTVYSQWANGRFFVNTANDAPGLVNIVSPTIGGQVDSTTPTLTVANSIEPEGEVVTYAFQLYSDAALTQLVGQAAGLAAGANGSTSWIVPAALTNNAKYYWRVTASDPHGAQTQSAVANFTVNLSNTAPTGPTLLSPLDGATVSASVNLQVANSSDADNDVLTYRFELDKVNSFNSPAKQGSGQLAAGNGITAWAVSNLAEDTQYYWRAKANDGKADSPWVSARFFVNASNNPPSVPVLKNPGTGAWVDTLQPKLEVGVSTDPEGGSVSYEFAIYNDVALASKAGGAITSTPDWLVTPPLTNGKNYYWHARAMDAQGTASNWSATGSFAVSTAVVSKPSITLTTPANVETSSGQTYTINWEARDPENNASIALYYSLTNNGVGQVIVDNIKQDPQAAGGSYAWNIGAMAPGAYYLYGTIYNSRASDTRFAPGAVVVPLPNPKGVINVTPATNLVTGENGVNASFQVVLGNAPSADVVVGVSSNNSSEGTVSPASLTFTPSNWSQAQTVAVKGVDDCVVDGNATYKAVLAKAMSLDANYNGLKANDLTYTNLDNDIGANSSPLVICNYALISSKAVTRYEYDYTYQAKLTNTGQASAGATAALSSSSPYTKVIDGALSFGPVGTGQTVTSTDTFVIRQDRRYTYDSKVFSWVITAK